MGAFMPTPAQKAEHATVVPHDAEGPKSILLCTPVWGAEYVRVFTDLVLGSLLAADNIPALAEKFDCVFLIYTNKESEALLRASASFRKLEALLAVQIHYIEDIDGADKYGMLTACYNDAIRIGAEHRQAFIFLNADMIYSNCTFAAVAKRIEAGKRCIEIDGFRTKKQGMEAALRRQFNDVIDISPSNLVGLALEHIHSISQSHLWETETDGGFIPFHTYWRAGEFGLVGKLSHLYPLYLYPRNWDLSAAKTIDWDLIDQAALRSDDIHLVLESDELFVAELSDENYVIAPTFPEGGTIQGMRQFVANSYTDHHRDCLRYSSRLRVKSGGDLLWRWAELKAFMWQKAICDHSIVASVAMSIITVPGATRRLFAKLFETASQFAAATLNREAISKSPRILSYLMGRDPVPYLTLMRAAPGALCRQLYENWNPLPFRRSKLAAIDSEYENICLGKESPLPIVAGLDLVLSRDEFFGVGWRMPKSYPARQIGKGGTASLFVRLSQKRAYRVSVTVAKVPFDLGNNLRLEINAEPLRLLRVESEDLWRVKAVIPPAVVDANEGRLKLTIRLTSRRGKPKGSAFISRVEVEPYSTAQESILAQRGLCQSLYSSFLAASEKYKRVYEDCAPEAEWDEVLGDQWISLLNDTLASDVLPSAVNDISQTDIALSENIAGYGWGRAGTWGAASYRWLGGNGSSSIFLKLEQQHAFFLKVYLHTCPQDLLGKLRLKINGRVMPAQGLKWDKDRYYIWVDVPESEVNRRDGVVELSIFVDVPGDSREDVKMREQLKRMFSESLLQPQVPDVCNIAFTRIVVIKHDMINTKAEVLALRLQQRRLPNAN